MPIYEFRCRTCGTRFEQLRPGGAPVATVACPEGHGDVERLLSLIAPGSSSGTSSSAAPSTGGGGGGGGGACCAAGCACGRN